MSAKRVVVLSDLHAGHEFGLCPPRNQRSIDMKAGRFQRELWQFYTKAIDALRPIDVVLVNGDAIEGKGESSGGVELVTPDRHEQARMAAECIAYIGAPVVRLMFGTKRHTGKEEDFEVSIVDNLKGVDAKIQGHGFLKVNGWCIDIKHKVASSTIPHGRLTGLAKARMWNVNWHAEHERQPKADILIRSHVHYYGYAGGPDWLGITTPALTYHSHFGVRECEGVVHVGFLVFDFNEDGGYTWRPILADFKSLKVRPESL